MPELAEVEWYRKKWNPGIGHYITAVAIHAKKRVFRGADTTALRQCLTNAKLLSSHARGKRMLFRFSNEGWLGVHLGMTGTLRIEPENFVPGKHDHLVLRQRERSLVFRDSRQFGRVRFHHGGNEPDWWASDVPEIVSPEFNRDFVDKFLARHGKAPIKAVLLMQNGFPGIGNWMADEILWRAKLLPSRLSKKLKGPESAALLRETKFVVRRSMETLGRDNSDPPRGWLIHERWSKSGVCPKHRTPLRRATIGGRTTAWCPKCQK